MRLSMLFEHKDIAHGFTGTRSQKNPSFVEEFVTTQPSTKRSYHFFIIRARFGRWLSSYEKNMVYLSNNIIILSRK